MTENQILDHNQVQHKIRRIAYQIAEVYLKDDRIILAGIANGGYTFAKELKKRPCLTSLLLKSCCVKSSLIKQTH